MHSLVSNKSFLKPQAQISQWGQHRIFEIHDVTFLQDQYCKFQNKLVASIIFVLIKSDLMTVKLHDLYHTLN